MYFISGFSELKKEDIQAALLYASALLRGGIWRHVMPDKHILR